MKTKRIFIIDIIFSGREAEAEAKRIIVLFATTLSLLHVVSIENKK